MTNEEIGKALVQCEKHWIWLPGMLDNTGYRVTDNGIWPKSNRYPEINDPCTKGGILQVLRNAWNCPNAHLVRFRTRVASTSGMKLVPVIWWALCLDDDGPSEATPLTNEKANTYYAAGPTPAIALLRGLQFAPEVDDDY